MNNKDIDIYELEKRIKFLENELNCQNLEKRIKFLENELNCQNLDNRIKTLEKELMHIKKSIQYQLKKKKF